MNSTWKSRDVSAKLNFNSESECDTSDIEDTNHLSDNHNFDGDMAYFYNKIVQEKGGGGVY